MRVKKSELERRYERSAQQYLANERNAQKNAAALKKARQQLARAKRRIKDLEAELARLRARGKNGKA